MDAHAHVAALAALYGHRQADAQELANDLPALGDEIHARLSALHRAPNADDAERLAVGLEGAQRHMLQLAEAIRREVPRAGA